MAEPRQRLAAIVAADVAGYSRLMAADEAATVAALDAARATFRHEIETNHGRVVDMAGDSVLSVFDTAAGAVQAAIAIQEQLAAASAAVPDDRRMRFRIGVHLGDIIEKDDGTVYGDGVNVASRLEALAEPGGVAVSGAVHDGIRGRFGLSYHFLGEQQVKNLPEPVRAYRVAPGRAGAPETTAAAATPYWRRKPFLAAAAAALVIAAGAALWQTSRAPEPAAVAEKGAAESAEPGLALPIGPSIAVLPFDNLSDDPEQEYFADGITEDIITDLSRFPALLVIARNSTFAYKGKPVSVQEVSRELGVRYVLEGSLRRAGDQIRITAQLVDAGTGYHLWAERYDRKLTDIFSVQDDITEKIVTALDVAITDVERARVTKEYTTNLAAYDYYIRARRLQGGVTREGNEEARRLLEKAIELDPGFAAAYAELSLVLHQAWYFSWGEDPQRSKEQSLKMAKTVVSLDDGLAQGHTYLAWNYVWMGEYEKAIEEGKRAISLNPNYADGYLYLSHIMIYAGQPEEGIRVAQRGLVMDPYSLYHHLFHLADGYWMLGEHEKSIESLRRGIIHNPDFLPNYLWLAAIYGETDRVEEAGDAAAEVLRRNPEFISEIWRNLPYKDRAWTERIVDGLRKAGLDIPDEGS